MTGYVKIFDKTDGIDTIRSGDFESEFTAIQSAFDQTSGHKHDGTASEGPYIRFISDSANKNKVVTDGSNNEIEFWNNASGLAVQQLSLTDGLLAPVTTNDVDLGSTTKYFKNIYGNVPSVVNVKTYGAVGNGTNDDTAEIQAALNTGYHVYLPEGNYKISAALTLTADGQQLFGCGENSKVTMSGSGYLAGILMQSRKGCTVSNLQVYSNAAISSVSLDAGVMIRQSTFCKVHGVTIRNHRAAGIALIEANDNEVSNCLFRDSPVADLDDNAHCLADIYLAYSSNRNTITENHCNSGQGQGICIQALLSTDSCDYNIVSNNELYGCRQYGIVCYVTDPAGSAKGNIIIGNKIQYTYGTILAVATSQYNFGSSIYIQNAEDCVVTGNLCTNSHWGDVLGTVTITELLAPGSIGVGNLTRCTINGNNIVDSGLWGMYIVDSGDKGLTSGGAQVTGNTITNCEKDGIRLQAKGWVSVVGNYIDDCAESGIRLNNATDVEETIKICENTISTCAQNGIQVLRGKGVSIHSNHIDNITVDGIIVQTSETISILGNLIREYTNRGIVVPSGNSGTICIDGNIIVGTGSSAEGLQVGSLSQIGDNPVSGVASAANTYTGAYNHWQALTANSATPAVDIAKTFITANTVPTTITNFTGALDGQSITVVVNDANTTLDFSASSLIGNNGVDRVMASGDAFLATYRRASGKWYVSIIDS